MFLVILLLLLIISSFLINSILCGFFQINSYELQESAQRNNSKSKKLYPLHRQGYSVVVLLLIDSIVIHVALIATAINVFPLWATIIVLPFILLLSSFILPLLYAHSIGLSLLAWKADFILRVVGYISPFMKPLSRFIESRLDMHGPHMLGSKKELYALLDKHAESPNSAIAAYEIELVRHSLDFNSKKVSDYMIPRRIVKRVAVSDEVGPILIDELHKSGHSRFPVYSDKEVDTFIGVLFLRDLVDVRTGGEVKQFMHKSVYYIHEEESLYRALQIILQSNQQLLVVVNTFEEFVGVITIEDILEQIIGAEIVDEFDQHDNLRAVAASMAEKEATKRPDITKMTEK